jgi:SAM-dependent methyltransferase
MKSGTANALSDVDYIYGYYPELNPLRVQLALLRRGLRWPSIGTACELGFGQGLSANLHAAASTVAWWGTDFNPAQAGFAQELAIASGANANFSDDAFADFVKRPDLPQFDYICLHGIWSWISDENRNAILDFVRRKLRVGGVLYVSYNTLPGWAGFSPIRHLMVEHMKALGTKEQGIMGTMEKALGFAEKFLSTNPVFKRHYPSVSDHLNHIKKENMHYLVHEYLSDNWNPLHFADVVNQLQAAKVQFACSASTLQDIDMIHFTPEQLGFLREISDPVFSQTARDFMINQRFRRDYWIKGARPMPAQEQTQHFRNQRVVLSTHRTEITLDVKGTLGKIPLKEKHYRPVIDLMADHKPRTLGEIENLLRKDGISLTHLVEVMTVLAGIGHMGPAADDAAIEQAAPRSKALNTFLLNKARSSTEISYLASPVLGGGVWVGQFEQLFLLSIQEGGKSPQDWAKAAWTIMAARGQRLMKNGSIMERDEDNLAELTLQAKEFAAKRLSSLQALRVA